MSPGPTEQVQEALEALYRSDSGRIRATLIRLLGDFDSAEDALQDAFHAALERWPVDGIPRNPRSWLISTGRFKAIDAIRRQSRFDASQQMIAEEVQTASTGEPGDLEVQDDSLRLIFTCCHPTLAPEARIALTLREVCGLTTEEIARAFLTSAPTIAQRIVRAKARIREAAIPYQVPQSPELHERLAAVLRVVYLVFNEGYSPASGPDHVRPGVSHEAIRLGRLLCDLLPEPEVLGLLALMLLHESRRPARVCADGELILLEQQNRLLWNREMIREGTALARRALQTGRFGAYSLQAAIAAVHAAASSAAETNWQEIVAFYDLLARIEPSPVVELNRAVAVAMHKGADAGLVLIDALLRRGELAEYHLAHSARAELCRRLGRLGEARESYVRALSFVRQDPERRFIEMQLRDLDQNSCATLSNSGSANRQ